MYVLVLHRHIAWWFVVHLHVIIITIVNSTIVIIIITGVRVGHWVKGNLMKIKSTKTVLLKASLTMPILHDEDTWKLVSTSHWHIARCRTMPHTHYSQCQCFQEWEKIMAVIGLWIWWNTILRCIKYFTIGTTLKCWNIMGSLPIESSIEHTRRRDVTPINLFAISESPLTTQIQ